MGVVVDRAVDPVVAAYTGAWRRITSELATLEADPRQVRRVARLRELERRIARELAVLDRDAAPAARATVHRLRELGTSTGVVASGGVSVQFAMLDNEAVRRTATGLYRDLLEATSHVDRTTKRFLRTVARDQQLQKLIQGRTAVDAGRRVAELARQRGVHAVRYANGARHGLEEYASMALRTVSGEVYNGGLIDGAVSEGVEWFEIFDGPDCGLEFHADGTVADGMVVDERTARTFALSHPNCRRSYGARPDLRSAKAAEDAGRSTQLASRQDQIAADLERGLPMSERGIAAAAEPVRPRAPSVSDPRGYRAARDG